MRGSPIVLLLLSAACSAPPAGTADGPGNDQSVLLHSDGPRGPGPVDVVVETASPPPTSPALARLDDGTPVRIDVLPQTGTAKTTRMRLRFVDPQPFSDDGLPHHLVLHFAATPPKTDGFALAESEGCQQLSLRGRPVWRRHDRFDPKDFDATFKPYHDLFDPLGTTQITKGLGGTYPHHRGLFVGWNKTEVGGKSLDFWHCTQGRHQVRVDGTTSLFPVVADSTDIVEWRDTDEHPVVRETRKLSVWDTGDEQRVIDVEVTLDALGTTRIHLDGDPQHAGCQVRLAEEVSTHQADTRYVRSAGAQDKGNDVWADCSFACIHAKVGDVDCVVLHASHPSNKGPLVYSTRSYGRLGSFQAFDLVPGSPVTLRYRLVIATEQHPGACADPAAASADWSVTVTAQGEASPFRFFRF